MNNFSGDKDSARKSRREVVLQEVQPALLGLMDGSVSTLAPLFAAAGIATTTFSAFLVGLAASLGAGISMGLSEALSDDGAITGRGSPIRRGLITGAATTMGGMMHSLPFLISDRETAMTIAYCVVCIELVAIAWIRTHFMGGSLAKTVIQIILGGAIVFGLGVWIGSLRPS